MDDEVHPKLSRHGVPMDDEIHRRGSSITELYWVPMDVKFHRGFIHY
jgi:hypothetical protein